MKYRISAILMIMLALLTAVAMTGCTTGTISVGSTPTPASADIKAGLASLPDYKIEIIGGNISPLTITYEDIKAMDFVEMDNVTMVKANGAEITSDFICVPMGKILAKVGVPDGNVTFKLFAPDGYVMVYTRQQLESSLLGLKRNNTALTDDVNTDPIQLVLPGERGAMWMKVPVRIEIESQ